MLLKLEHILQFYENDGEVLYNFERISLEHLKVYTVMHSKSKQIQRTLKHFLITNTV